MRLSFKIIAALITGIIALIALLYFQLFSQHYFSDRQKVNDEINMIENAEKSLDYQVLHSGFFLYSNQDEIVNKINTVEKMINNLQNNPHFIKNHPISLKNLNAYEKAFQYDTQAIYDFQTANTAIKNATMAIPALQNDAITNFNTNKNDELIFLKKITKISSSVLLAKNSLDSQMISGLDGQIDAITLHNYFKNTEQQDISAAFIGNLKVFRDFFPQYKEAIDTIELSRTKEMLAVLRQSFFTEDQSELNAVTYFSYLLVVLYISSLGLIIYFLIQSEIDARTDQLTRLGNRKAYEAMIRHGIPSTLFLFNINKFKNYNDFYGIASGDQILKLTAQRLKTLCQSWDNPELYRLGGDEFGVVIVTDEKNNPVKLGKALLKEFHSTPMVIEGIETSLSITLAISTQSPLLETADMALKSIKEDRTKNVILYHSGLNLLQVVQENIIKTHELHHAVEHDRLIPHFQPIVSLVTGQIEKYEALARLVMDDGEIRSIFGYLNVVKESKYYSTLTRIMVQKSFAMMKHLPYKFSINLSIDDITDHETVKMITNVLDQNHEMAIRVVFEILESEAMHDYAKVVDFIQIVKEYGCQIALDDFGSGYSNFHHILSLDIDIIKLDGSLIQHIDTSPHAFMIVETIVDFAKKAGKKTVAEFVWNQAVYDTVKKLGIDYAQGYYTGKPEALS
jgi:diguanylate cyclase (GGDEF)-like protein